MVCLYWNKSFIDVNSFFYISATAWQILSFISTYFLRYRWRSTRVGGVLIAEIYWSLKTAVMSLVFYSKCGDYRTVKGLFFLMTKSWKYPSKSVFRPLEALRLSFEATEIGLIFYICCFPIFLIILVDCSKWLFLYDRSNIY